MAFEMNFGRHSRHVQFGGFDSNQGKIIILGENWTGAAFKWSFSTVTNAEAGTAATGFTLNAAAAGAQGVSVAWDAAYVHPRSGQIVGASIITPQIDKATLEALTFTGTADLVLNHEFLAAPTGKPRREVCNGTLPVKQGIAS